jgi:hypothetical protein
MNVMNEQTDRKLQAKALLARRMEGDYLMLADAVMDAALDGSRALTASERGVLRTSPLTLRRFQVLAAARRQAVNLEWQGSHGMLRAAAGGPALRTLATDDGFWTLHFLEQAGQWRVILALDAGAPFAASLLRARPMLRVLDGQGAVVMQASLDSDGECEGDWPFAAAPEPHFQQAGASFAVQPALA